jgi:hypothetical protein
VIFVFGLALAESEFEVKIAIMEGIELLFEFSDALLRCGCGGFVHGMGGDRIDRSDGIDLRQ